MTVIVEFVSLKHQLGLYSENNCQVVVTLDLFLEKRTSVISRVIRPCKHPLRERQCMYKWYYKSSLYYRVAIIWRGDGKGFYPQVDTTMLVLVSEYVLYICSFVQTSQSTL